jgi:hypothetical protein
LPKIKEAGATGHILLWLIGIPIPILPLIFLLRVAHKIWKKIKNGIPTFANGRTSL